MSSSVEVTNPLFAHWENRETHLKVSPLMTKQKACEAVHRISDLIQSPDRRAWAAPSSTGQGFRVVMKKKVFEYLQHPREPSVSGLLDRCVSYRCVYYCEPAYAMIKQKLEPFRKGGLKVEFDDEGQKITHFENKSTLWDLELFGNHELDPLYSNDHYFTDHESFQSRMNTLISETKEFFSSLPDHSEQILPYKEGDDLGLIVKLLEGRQGFCVAEAHNWVNGRKWLIENMAALK